MRLTSYATFLKRSLRLAGVIQMRLFVQEIWKEQAMSQFSATSLAKHEIYRSLKALHNQYERLSTLVFVCRGSKSLCLIITSLIDRILKRFSVYNDDQALDLSRILQSLQDWYVSLRSSVSSEVAWSIVPSLEELFGLISPKSQYVISSTWLRTYLIDTYNALDVLRHTIISGTEGILDNTEEGAQIFFNGLLNEHDCDSIYVLHYPRVKRLSALHFALFGHELGHLIYKEWAEERREEFFENNALLNKIEVHAANAITGAVASDNPRFDEIKTNLAVQYFKSMARCLEEICCDIVGCWLFGFNFLLSAFKFSSIHDFESISELPYGYYPWAFRTKICLDTIELLRHPYDGRFDDNVSEWIKELREYNTSFQYDREIISHDGYSFHTDMIDAITSSLGLLVDQLGEYLREESLKFENDFSLEQMKSVKSLLEKRVIPSCHTVVEDNQLIQTPLGMRNIISGTWLHLVSSDIDIDNTEDYYDYSKRTNLLSLKGIELSKIQRDFLESEH